MQYSKVELKRAPSTHSKSRENRYWNRFAPAFKTQYNAPVTDIAFKSTRPHDFAVSCSTRVVIINPQTCTPRKTISRFKNVAYSGSFRADGKLLVAGSEDKRIRVFDLESRTILRTFRGHKLPVHVSLFDRDETHIISASDDTTLKLWDLATEKQLVTFRGHTDYVRCAVQSSMPHAWVSGSYDGTLRVWDIRANNCGGNFKQGNPLHALLARPDSPTLMSAGDNEVKVWDLRGSGSSEGLVTSFSSHQKQITGLAWGLDGQRVLTSSLDQHVKVHDVQSWSVVHSFKFDDPLMSLALSPDNTTLVVGSVAGHLHVRRRTPGGRIASAGAPSEDRPKVDENQLADEAGSISALAAAALKARGLAPNEPDAPAAGRRRKKSKNLFTRAIHSKPQEDDIVTSSPKKQKLRPYDVALKQFEYAKALDAALSTRNLVVVASVLQELLLRGDDALQRALANRTDKEIAPILEFLVQTLGNPHFADIAVDCTHVLLDLYSSRVGESLLLDEQLSALNSKLQSECQLQRSLLSLSGTMQIMLSKAHQKQVMHPRLAARPESETEGDRDDSKYASIKPEASSDAHERLENRESKSDKVDIDSELSPASKKRKKSSIDSQAPRTSSAHEKGTAGK
eukprot:g76888.t1